MQRGFAFVGTELDAQRDICSSTPWEKLSVDMIRNRLIGAGSCCDSDDWWAIPTANTSVCGVKRHDIPFLQSTMIENILYHS